MLSGTFVNMRKSSVVKCILNVHHVLNVDGVHDVLNIH